MPGRKDERTLEASGTEHSAVAAAKTNEAAAGASGSQGETAQKILAAARVLFARHGYDGVSVRDICGAAGCNANAVHYHFESKPGLFAAILRQFGAETLASARRALAQTPRDASEFRTRLQIFLEETLTSFLEQRDLVMIVHTEFLKASPRGEAHLPPETLESLSEAPRFLAYYFSRARDAGILRSGIDPDLFAQLLMKPALMMVLNCPGADEAHGDSIENPEYRAQWCEQILGILLDGALARPQ